MHRHLTRTVLTTASLTVAALLPLGLGGSASAAEACSEQQTAYLSAQEQQETAAAHAEQRRAELERDQAQARYDAVIRAFETASAAGPLSDVQHDRLLSRWERASEELDDAQVALDAANARKSANTAKADAAVDSTREALDSCLRNDSRAS